MNHIEAILKELKGIKSTLSAIAIHIKAIDDPFDKGVKNTHRENLAEIAAWVEQCDKEMSLLGTVTTEWSDPISTGVPMPTLPPDYEIKNGMD